MQPYIGITGFTTPAEVEMALDAWPVGSSRKLMVGVLASSKTLTGISLKSHLAARYPRVENIASLFIDDPRVLNLVHFHSEATDPSPLYDELMRMREFAGPNLHGFQLNIAWPSPAVIDILQRNHLLTFVLQLGSRALEEAHHDPLEIARRVQRYNGAIEYVLLDASGGQGKPFETETVRTILRQLKAPGLHLVIAGGLGPTTLHRVEPLVQEFHDISIDAEHALRIPHNGLDPECVRIYLQKSHELFATPS